MLNKLSLKLQKFWLKYQQIKLRSDLEQKMIHIAVQEVYSMLHAAMSKKAVDNLATIGKDDLKKAIELNKHLDETLRENLLNQFENQKEVEHVYG